MSTITVDLTPSLQGKLEGVAKEMGLSVGQLLAQTAEKILQAQELNVIKERAKKRDTRTGFERVLALVPDVPPSRPDDVIE